jgi:branched-chain amino acid transport system substrate-binding protein
LAGNFTLDFVFISAFNSTRDQKTKELNAKVIKKYGNPPAKFATTAIAYDSVYLIKASIEKSGSTDKVAIHDALENIEKYDGVYKFYDNPFDKMNHDALNSKDFYLAEWVDGTVVDTKDDVSKLEIR